jgi:hypothetical protein
VVRLSSERFNGSADVPLPEVTIPPVHTRVTPLSRPDNDGSYHTIGYRKLDLFSRELAAVDGTRLKVVNSMDSRAISDKISANTCLDTATSAIWSAGGTRDQMVRVISRPRRVRRTTAPAAMRCDQRKPISWK